MMTTFETKLAADAAALGDARQLAQTARGAAALACALIIGEPEQLVLERGSAHGVAELVALEDRDRWVEEGARIHIAVAQKFERRAVPFGEHAEKRGEARQVFFEIGR